MQPTNLAILVSDLHFSNAPPVARAGEPDWFDAMGRRLQWLRSQAETYGVPIVAAGDIWDKPVQHPAVVNYILDNCPKMYAIPGQHDLPGHVYDHRHRSAYGTLVRCGVLVDLETDVPLKLADKFYVVGYPWGSVMEQTITPKPDVVVLAVCHKYIHNGAGTHYNGADNTGLISNLKLRGFAAIHCGDNHIPFEGRSSDGALVINTGAFYRRAADQEHFNPSAVLLYKTPQGVGFHRLYYDTADESFDTSHLHKIESFAAAHSSVDTFLQSLVGGTEKPRDFSNTLRQYLEAHGDELGPNVTRLIACAIP